MNENPKWLPNVNPFKGEEVVCQLLREAFGWEVKHIGGRRDKGIDALALAVGDRRTIVQVKWRRDNTGAESVATVRELAGTLLARGIPHGLLVTTSARLSRDATSEVEEINQREISQIGRLNIQWKTYADVLDMLEITSVRVNQRKRVPFENRDHGNFYIFDGGGVWDPDWHHVASEADRKASLRGDPYLLIGEILANGYAGF